MKIYRVLCALFFLINSTLVQALTEKEVIEKAEVAIADGLEGLIHGAVAENEQFVFRWTPDPKEFFSYFDFPLIATDEKILKTLATFARHDLIKVKGEVKSFPAPHIKLSEVTLVKKYDENAKAYEKDTKAIKDLKEKAEADFQVHGAFPEQGMVVLEYKDWIFPYTDLSEDYLKKANFYRGDLVHAFFDVQEFPKKPTHLTRPEKNADPIKITDRLKDRNGKEETIRGILVQYPKSPLINRDVYAVEVEQRSGFVLNFVLINFDNPDEDQALQKKLTDAWKDNKKTEVLGRNHFRNPNIVVKVKGKVNVVSSKQANPQLTVSQAADLDFVKK